MQEEKPLFSGRSMSRGTVIFTGVMAVFFTLVMWLVGFVLIYEAHGNMFTAAFGAVMFLLPFLFYYIFRKSATLTEVYSDEIRIKYLFMPFAASRRVPLAELASSRFYRDFQRYGYTNNVEITDRSGNFYTLIFAKEADLSGLIEILDRNKLMQHREEADLFQRELIYDQHTNYSGSLWATLALMFFVNTCSFIGFGIGAGHESDNIGYVYNGSASYTDHKAYLRILDVANAPQDYDYLRFGQEADFLKELKVQILASELDTTKIAQVFYDPHEWTSLSKDSVYAVSMGIRSNYWSFPFQRKYAFYATPVQKHPPGYNVPPLSIKSGWNWKLLFYSLLTHLQLNALVVFFMAIGYSSPIRIDEETIFFNKSRSSLRLVTIVATIFTLATVYKTWADAPFNDTWMWIWEVMLYIIVIVLWANVTDAWKNSRDYVRMTRSHFEFKDNELEMKIPYSAIQNLRLINNVDASSGRSTDKGELKFDYEGRTLHLMLDDMNLGSCDEEIATELKKRVKAAQEG